MSSLASPCVLILSLTSAQVATEALLCAEIHICATPALARSASAELILRKIPKSGKNNTQALFQRQKRSAGVQKCLFK